MARPNDRVFFALTAVAGALILVGCVLPAFELYLFATVGGGDDQQGYDFYRELRFATYPEPGALVFPLGGLAFVAAGILGVLRQRALLIFVVVVLTVPAFVQTIRTIDIQGATEEGGVSSCEKPRLEDCVYYLAPAVRDLRADILRRPVARRPEFLGPSPNYYSVRRLSGWQLIGWTVAAFTLFAWFRAALLLPLTSAQAAVAYAGALVTVFLIVILWLFRDFEP